MPDERLKRTLGLGSSTFFGVGAILGAGIYTIIGKVAGHAGNLLWLAFAVASVTAVLTAFSYAELSAACPRAGGEYAYGKLAFPQKVALVLGIIVSLNAIVSGATVALGFAGYLAQLLDWGGQPAALALIALIAGISVLGIRQSSWLNIGFTLVEFGGLAFVVYAAWPSLGRVDLLAPPPGGLNAVLLGASLSFFAYTGFQGIVKLAEEVREPEKNLPRALFLANGIVVVAYAFIAVTVVSAVPWQQLGRSQGPLADVAAQRFGPSAAVALAVVALFSTANTVLADVLATSRVLLDVGNDYRPLHWLARVSSKRQTPLLAVLLTAATMAAFVLIGRLETVALVANFFVFLMFLLMNLAVIVLRRRQPELERPFRVPLAVAGVPLPSALGLLLTLLLLGYGVYGLTQGAR